MMTTQTRRIHLEPVDTTIPRKWQTAARAAWIAAAVVGLVLWSLGTYEYAVETPPECAVASCDPFALSAEDIAVITELGLPPDLLRGFWVATNIILALPIFVMAGALFWLRSDDWLALLVAFTLIFLGSVGFTESNDALFRSSPSLRLPLELLSSSGFGCLILLLFVFPDGRLVPRGRITPWVLGTVVLLIIIPFGDTTWGDNPNPLAVVLVVLCGLVAQIYRYQRISSSVHKQQSKWVVLGLLGSLSLMVIWFAMYTYLPPAMSNPTRIYIMIPLRLMTVGLIIALPVSLGFSILRYRLWDIDFIIRRTLTYALVTGLLAVAYFGGVIVLQTLFNQLTGGESPLAVVASTLMIAALFAPLRRTVQSFVDRRFNRGRYDAQQTLEKFGDIARDEVNLEELEGALIRTIHDTMQPEHVSLWLATEKE